MWWTLGAKKGSCLVALRPKMYEMYVWKFFPEGSGCSVQGTRGKILVLGVVIQGWLEGSEIALSSSRGL